MSIISYIINTIVSHFFQTLTIERRLFKISLYFKKYIILSHIIWMNLEKKHIKTIYNLNKSTATRPSVISVVYRGRLNFFIFWISYRSFSVVDTDHGSRTEQCETISGFQVWNWFSILKVRTNSPLVTWNCFASEAITLIHAKWRETISKQVACIHFARSNFTYLTFPPKSAKQLHLVHICLFLLSKCCELNPSTSEQRL